MAKLEYKSLGFVGIGAMGRPMVEHLSNKLPADCAIYIFDVSEKTVDEVCAEHKGKIIKCSSAKDVAEKSVSTRRLVDLERVFIA